MTEPVYWNVYANVGQRDLSIADISKAWAELETMGSTVTAITVAPDIEKAARKIVDDESANANAWLPRLDVYVDPSLPAGSWHYGKPRWMR